MRAATLGAHAALGCTDGGLQLSLRALRENASHFAIYTNSIGPQPPAGAAPSQCSATGLGAMCASHRPVESALRVRALACSADHAR
jgi:hypothetical protein